MPLSEAEFSAILDDTSKTISGDIKWTEDEDHSPAVEFRVEVQCDAGQPLVVCASYNALAGTLSYALIHRSVGRIYALDLGKDHHNPTCTMVGEKHKHRWTDLCRDKEAYAPPDITAGTDRPVEVWRQFCNEAKIRHQGTMFHPPPCQTLLLP